VLLMGVWAWHVARSTVVCGLGCPALWRELMHCSKCLVASPNARECCHRVLARRLGAVRRRAVLMLAEGDRVPMPSASSKFTRFATRPRSSNVIASRSSSQENLHRVLIDRTAFPASPSSFPGILDKWQGVQTQRRLPNQSRPKRGSKRRAFPL